MKITNSRYSFWRVENSYYIKNLSLGPVVFSVYSVTNNINTLIIPGGRFVPTNITEAFILDKEGIYFLEITFLDSDNVTSLINTYSLRYFKTLKENIIASMRSVICDCEGSDEDCGQVSSSKNSFMLREIEVLYNSVWIYRDLLLSPSFIRNYLCCFTNTLGDDSSNIINSLVAKYSNILVNGNFISYRKDIRFYTAYLYLLFYCIEMDTALYTEEDSSGSSRMIGEYNDGEITDIEDLFILDNITNCFTELSIDKDIFISTFNNCYENYPIGICSLNQNPAPIDPDKATIAALTYTNHISRVAIGQTVIPTLFLWAITGTPADLILEDNNNKIINQPVSGTSYSSAVSYELNVPGTIIWTLSGSNVTPITMSTQWVYASYFGVNVTGNIPTETDILAASVSTLDDVTNEFIIPIVTTEIQYGWFAVPSITPTYTDWQEVGNETNKGNIENEVGKSWIIKRTDTVIVNNTAYDIYQYRWAVANNYTIRLYA